MVPIPVQERPTARPRIPAVVPAYGEGRNAASLLRAELATLSPACEIEMVTDGPTIVVSTRFFSGAQLLSLGIIGEDLGRVFGETGRRPRFLATEAVDRSRLPPRERRSPG